MRLCVLFTLAITGCASGPGDSCEPSDGRCEGGASALLCVDGELRRLRCGGETGCGTREGSAHCDQGLARAGEACAGATACSEDRSTLLVCRGGRFVEGARCPHGCILEIDRATCPMPEILPPLQ